MSLELRTGLALAALAPCLTCGGPADVVAAFIPDPAAWDGRPGTHFYALCARCKASTTVEEREDALRPGHELKGRS